MKSHWEQKRKSAIPQRCKNVLVQGCIDAKLQRCVVVKEQVRVGMMWREIGESCSLEFGHLFGHLFVK